jgi:hypothetical protein
MSNQPETPKLSKADSARKNGALSHGPKTKAGLANSANARLKHGAYSKRVLMDGESFEGYELFKGSFVNLFLPIDAFEAECVESMVTARWRIRRLESAETSNLNIALDANKEKVATTFDAIDTVHERAVAVQDQMSAIDANTRVQERLHRIYDRSFKLLANYRKQAGRKIPAPLSGDPLKDITGMAPPPTVPPVADPPASGTSILTDDPTEKPNSSPSAASLTAKAAILLVIFVISFLAPVTAFSKSLPSIASPSAFYAPVGSANPESAVK